MGKTLIIGAGAAGLYAGQLLQEAGLPYRIFEAQPKYGGRMRHLQGFVPFPLPLGAEEIHGQRSLPAQLAQKLDYPLSTREGLNYLFLDGKLQSEKQLRPNKYFRKARRFVDKLYRSQKESYTNVQDFIVAEGFPQQFRYILNAWIGNEYGSDNQQLGLRELAEMEANWAVGNRNLNLAQGSILELFEKSFPAVFENIQLNTPIQTIDYQLDNTTITDQNGKRYIGQYVLVTAPLALLQQGGIVFRPDLPAAKQQALEALKMGPGIKFFLRFHRAFWPKDMESLYAPGPVPEFWTCSRPDAPSLLTGLIHGEAAAYFAQASEEQVLGAILQQLQQVFGPNINNQLDDYHIIDWTKDPYVRGSYSYPSPGEGKARQILSQSIQDRLFFAGEACNVEGHIATVHGAMETAEKAVAQILEKEGQ